MFRKTVLKSRHLGVKWTVDEILAVSAVIQVAETATDSTVGLQIETAVAVAEDVVVAVLVETMIAVVIETAIVAVGDVVAEEISETAEEVVEAVVVVEEIWIDREIGKIIRALKIFCKKNKKFKFLFLKIKYESASFHLSF